MDMDDMNITSKYDGKVLFSFKTDSMRICVEEAIKVGTNLSCADLSYTDLSHANLSYTNLSGANMSCANMSDSNMFRTDLSGSNMSGVKYGKVKSFWYSVYLTKEDMK